MTGTTPTILEIHNLSREMETLDFLGLQGMTDAVSLSQFQACAVELQEWKPHEGQSQAELMHGLSHMIMGAFSLHNHADMQRIIGKVDEPAATVPFDIAQSCLRKAIAVLEIAMRNAAREAFGPLSVDEAKTGESIH